MRSFVLAIFVFLGCDTQNAPQPELHDGRSQAHAVEPGACLGTHTQCDTAPAATTFPTEPLVPCIPTNQSAHSSIVWSTPLGEVSCPVGKCIAEAMDVAVDPTGGVWVETKLLLPSQMVITDDHSHGLGLSRFDAQGKLAFSTVVDFPTILAGDPPSVSGMRVDAGGHLLLLGPMVGRPGLELREYDRIGRLVSTRPLVDLARAGTASIDVNGALTLFYSYEPDGDAGSADPLQALQADDLARFDANGAPVWNQTVSRLLWPHSPGVSNAYPVFGARATAILDWIPAGGAGAGPQKVVAAVLDNHGNLSQLVEQEGASLESCVPTGPTSFAAVVRSMSSTDSSEFVTRFGLDGPEASRLDGALLSFPDDSIVGIDTDGRVWSWNSTGKAVLDAVSSDGSRCSSWRTTIETSAMTQTQTDYISPAFTVPKNGDAYFAVGGQVGLVRLGGLP